MENYTQTQFAKGLHISLNGWKTIFEANGVQINSTDSDNFIFVNIIDIDKKNNLYRYSKDELTELIKNTSKNLDLFNENPVEVMKVRAQRIAIDAYLSENNLFF